MSSFKIFERDSLFEDWMSDKTFERDSLFEDWMSEDDKLQILNENMLEEEDCKVQKLVSSVEGRRFLTENRDKALTFLN